MRARTDTGPPLAAQIISAAVVVGICLGLWWIVERRSAPPPPPVRPSVFSGSAERMEKK